MDANVAAPVRICQQFNAFNVTYIVKKKDTRPSIPNAFDKIMNTASQLSVQEKISERNNYEKLRNELVSYLNEKSLGWSKSIVETTGKTFVECLTSLLWHITCHHEYFREKSLDIPLIFQKYKNFDNYAAKHKSKPQLSSEKLSTSLDSLSGFLIQPWFSKESFRCFRKDVSCLVDSAKKMETNLRKVNDQMKKDHSLPHPTRKLDENTEITIKDSSTKKVHANYLDLDEKVNGLHLYEPLHLSIFEPEQRYQRRHWIDNIELSHSIALLKRSYAGTLGNINVIWKVAVDDERHETNMAKAVLSVTEQLPEYHTRKMRKDVLSKYLIHAKKSASLLNELYREATGDCSAPTNESEKEQRVRIAEFLATNDEDAVLTDLRSLNGKVGTSFDDFWDEVNKLFSEYEAAVQERRHGSFVYLPFAISIRELIDRVVKRRPGIRVPSAEWVRLQFAPKSVHHRSALQHTGRFNMKFQVQRRQMRSQHEDAKYVYRQQVYVREHAIRFKDHCNFISSDDKALIPVGEPGNNIFQNFCHFHP